MRPPATPVFLVEKVPQDQPAFRVLGPDGKPVAEIQEFLSYLATCGRSGYTLHSYATGLAHFFGWLHESGKHVDEVSRHMVGQYIAAFGRSPKRRLGARHVPETDLGDQDGRTRSGDQRRPRTINHRLSVLASFFAFCIQRDEDLGSGAWFQRANPISTTSGGNGRHGLAGRDRPARGRAGEFRRRVPREIHRPIHPSAAEQLINAAASYRDKCILTLLFRTGQRIGDWHDVAGRHGVLGMEMADIDEQRGTITVRLKWDRDEHRVPVTDDFWPLFRRYVAEERGEDATATAAWVAMRKGKGKPLTYVAFESSLRYVSRKVGVTVHAHMFRHTVAQAVLETTGNLKVAQELLGHAQVTTTADLYMHVDERVLVEAVSAVKSAFDGETNHANGSAAGDPLARERYVFAYDGITIEELEKAAVRWPSSPGDKSDANSESSAGLGSEAGAVQPR
jgi:site-specific recombinase XerD